MTLGQLHAPTPFFQLTFPISAQWGSHPPFSRNRGPAESVRGCDSDHLSSKGSARLSLPLKLGVFTNFRTRASGLHHQSQPHQRVLRVPEGTMKERRAMTSAQFDHSRLQPGVPLLALEISLHRKASLHLGNLIYTSNCLY